ncbi:hypothetical protein R1flu_001851 [Riccia fluitans]|uniref:Uncharacterized protein n=1 Tax=Riccia fluitans TaxID=41844 RepID=A0ABD1Y4V1_9MARC
MTLFMVSDCEIDREGIARSTCWSRRTRDVQRSLKLCSSALIATPLSSAKSLCRRLVFVRVLQTVIHPRAALKVP